MPETAPVFDLAEALNRAMGDVDFLKMMMDELQQTTLKVIATLQEAIGSSDMATAGNATRQLKAAAANLGAKALASAAFEMEKLGKNGNPEGALSAFRQLKSDSETLSLLLQSINWSIVAS